MTEVDEEPKILSTAKDAEEAEPEEPYAVDDTDTIKLKTPVPLCGKKCHLYLLCFRFW